MLDDVVTLLALDVRDEADAARVVFVRRVVETLAGGGKTGSVTAHLGWLEPRAAPARPCIYSGELGNIPANPCGSTGYRSASTHPGGARPLLCGTGA